MAEKNEMKKKLLALGTSVSLLAGGLFNPPADLAENPMEKIAPPPAISLVLPDLPSDDGGDDGGDALLPGEEKKKRSVAEWFKSQKLAVRLLVILPVILAVWALAAFAWVGVSAALPKLLAAIVGSVISAAVLIATGAGVAKALLPEVPMKKILSKKTVLIAVIAGTVISFAVKYLFTLL